MKILKIIIVVVVVLVLGALAFAMMQPAEGSLQSSIVINASPASVYEECVDIKKLDAWSPWYNIEPAAFSYEGPVKGIGATSMWDSEKEELGKGSLKIIEAVPNEFIRTEMKFESFPGKFSSWIKLSPEGEGTKVVWGYDYSEINIIGRFFMGMMDINTTMLPMFEQGLADLKQIVEAKPVAEPEMMEEAMESDSTMVE
ncbi:MAG TPA: SRPBCC family protein [Fulvivirga sp.]|nr:SRPBCC family protein [Fulvivirga sp.]